MSKKTITLSTITLNKILRKLTDLEMLIMFNIDDDFIIENPENEIVKMLDETSSAIYHLRKAAGYTYEKYEKIVSRPRYSVEDKRPKIKLVIDNTNTKQEEK